jgi:hypothetical protein
MLVRLAFAALLVSSVAVGGAAAQEPSPAAIATAKEMLTLKNGTTMFERIVPGVIESAKNGLIPTNPSVSKQLGEVAAQLHKELEPKKAELVNEICRIYAQRFTEAELKELLAFYKTPLGQKVIAEEPNALDLSMQRTQAWAETFSELVLSRFRAEMKKRGYDL